MHPSNILDEPVWQWLAYVVQHYREGIVVFFVVLFAIVLANMVVRLLIGRD